MISVIGLDRIENQIQELLGRFTSSLPAEPLISQLDPESDLVMIDVDSPGETVERL